MIYLAFLATLAAVAGVTHAYHTKDTTGVAIYGVLAIAGSFIVASAFGG
jgi:hypothetical protein